MISDDVMRFIIPCLSIATWLLILQNINPSNFWISSFERNITVLSHFPSLLQRSCLQKYVTLWHAAFQKDVFVLPSFGIPPPPPLPNSSCIYVRVDYIEYHGMSRVVLKVGNGIYCFSHSQGIFYFTPYTFQSDRAKLPTFKITNKHILIITMT